MPETTKAVFLSYASQDAEAAKRICEALRAAGVEVWFDQSELRGGDAWDQKIRRQIRECALFVPVITSNTNARSEGYFRLEWKLAVDRSHLMADDAHFIFPVMLGNAPDAAARVPDKFREVQWTRLREGESPSALVTRVARVLSGAAADAARAEPIAAGPAAPAAERARWSHSSGLRLTWGIIGGLLALTFATRPIWHTSRRDSPPAPAATSDASAEVARICANLRPDEWTRADFEALTPTIDRLVQANPENADVWALRGIANSLLVIRNLDSGTKPLELGREASDRALRLAPHSPLAELSLGMHLIAMISRGGDVHAPRMHVELALAALPSSKLTRYTDLCSFWLGYQFEGTEKAARDWLAVEPGATFPTWILAQSFVARRKTADAIEWSERASSDPDITGVRSLVTLFEARYYLQADLVGARAALDRVSASQRGVHRVAASRFWLTMAEQHYDQALQELARLPESMLRDRVFHGPKALLAGLAHEAAGRPEVAAVQFGDAERQLRAELDRDTENQELRAVLALTLACLGRADEARRELAAVEPLQDGQDTSVYSSELVVLIAQAHTRLGEYDRAATWLHRLLFEPSSTPFTPESLAVDVRFREHLAEAPIAALLGEFRSRNRPAETATPDAKSIAVLPFANLSADKENEYFVDGLHDDIITSLAKIRALKVISRTSVLAYRDTAARNLKKIAAELGVATVLEGSVRRVGEKVHMNAQLIDARTDEHLWADSFDGDATDVFALQAKLAQQIAAALKATLTPSERTRIEQRPTENREAYELYLRARGRQDELGENASMEDYERLLALYGQVLALDPDFALAHVQIAYVNSILYWFGYLDPSAARADRVKQAMEAAVRLAPDAPETHLALGLYRYRVLRRWDEALEQFRLAQAGLPNDGQLAFLTAITLRRLGRWTDALDSFDRTLELNPRDLTAVQNALQFNVDCRRFDAALRLLDRTAGFFPERRDIQLSRIRAKFARDNDLATFASQLASAPVDAVRFYGPVDQYRAAICRGDLEGAERLLAGETREALADVFIDNNAVPIPTALYRAQVACLRGDAASARTNAAKAEAYYRQGTWNERQVPWVRMQLALGSAFANGGLAAAREAEGALADIRARDAYDACMMRTEVAWVEVLAGRRDAALDILQEMMRTPASHSPNGVRADPILSRLRDDPRFEQILQAAKPL